MAAICLTCDKRVYSVVGHEVAGDVEQVVPARRRVLFVESAISHSATSNTHREFLLVGGSSTQSNVRTITAATPANVTSSTYSLVMGLSQS